MSGSPGRAKEALLISPPRAAPLADVPELPLNAFRAAVLETVKNGGRLVTLFGVPAGKAVRLTAAVGRDDAGTVSLWSTTVEGRYPALTPDCPQAQGFERELAETRGLQPEGHPWLKPLRALRTDGFFQVAGEEVHEVAVGPVHAGIIEPGHFRFQCHGERVLHLEIALGYQHRGVERALVGGPDAKTLHYMETAAGDTTVGHALAYCQAVEALARCEVPARAEAIRGIALELERLANHTGDLGALSGDVGFLPTAALCGRLRGDFLNMTAALCGNRFGRALLRPGGVGFDLAPGELDDLRRALARAHREVREAAGLLWTAPSVLARFEETGTLSQAACRELGLVGVAARASGLPLDVRLNYPSGAYRGSPPALATTPSGDVFGRAMVRWLEIDASVRWIEDRLQQLPGGAVRAPLGPLPPKHIALSLVEGWRGEICHAALTDARGRFLTYKIVDPSFHNWFGLMIAMRNQEISDFPLCNKSFNLSYSGHDL